MYKTRTENKNYDWCPILCFKIRSKTLQLEDPQTMQICFYILENKLNFGSKLLVPMSITTTSLENKVAEHLISDIKSLFARYDTPVEIKADNIS